MDSAPPDFRAAAADDRRALLQLLADLRVPVGGSTSAPAQRALVDAGLRSEMVIVVAELGGGLAGVGLGVIDPRRFWKQLALRNPWLIAERIPALIRRKLRRRRTGADRAEIPAELRPFLSPASGRQWGESSPQIGHVALVQVRPELRGSGLSTPLIGLLLDTLAQRGVTRADAHIAATNVPSSRMCAGAGMRIEDAGGYVFATIDLPRSGV